MSQPNGRNLRPGVALALVVAGVTVATNVAIGVALSASAHPKDKQDETASTEPAPEAPQAARPEPKKTEDVFDVSAARREIERVLRGPGGGGHDDDDDDDDGDEHGRGHEEREHHERGERGASRDRAPTTQPAPAPESPSTTDAPAPRRNGRVRTRSS